MNPETIAIPREVAEKVAALLEQSAVPFDAACVLLRSFFPYLNPNPESEVKTCATSIPAPVIQPSPVIQTHAVLSTGQPVASNRRGDVPTGVAPADWQTMDTAPWEKGAQVEVTSNLGRDFEVRWDGLRWIDKLGGCWTTGQLTRWRPIAPSPTPQEAVSADAALREWPKPADYPYTSPSKAFLAGHASRDEEVAALTGDVQLLEAAKTDANDWRKRAIAERDAALEIIRGLSKEADDLRASLTAARTLADELAGALEGVTKSGIAWPAAEALLARHRLTKGPDAR